MNLLKAFRRFIRNRKSFYAENTSFRESSLLDDLKFFNDWYVILNKKSQPFDLRLPWISVPAMLYLRNLLRPKMKVFEWGCGGSSLFFLELGCELISVDHCPHWSLAVNEKIQAFKRLQFVVDFIPPKSIPMHANQDSRIEVPTYRTTALAYNLKTFEKYVKRIDAFDDNTFDLIVVDGRARNSCIFHAIQKVKEDGFLLLDNSERREYQSGINLIPKVWRRADFIGPIVTGESFSCTTLWRKVF